MSFPVDHLAIWTADPDALTARIASLTGLERREGFRPEGALLSRGVRFANRPFLDIFAGDRPQVFMGLSAGVEAAERLCAEQGWIGEREPRDDEAQPWDILYLAANRGVFSRLFVIDYDQGHPGWAHPTYCGALYKTGLPARSAARLDRVWLTVIDPARAATNLRRLGFEPAGPLDEDAALFRGPRGDIVLVPCAPDAREVVVRLEIAGALEDAEEPFGEVLTLVTRRGD
jgi:hypothetical protein